MSGSRIMLVDDEAGIRFLLSEVLSEKGFEVTSAKDGMESLMYMKNNRFDLIITDINMPNIDGIELLKNMKRTGRKEKVVIMTGSTFDPSEIAEEIPLVCFQLKKPFKLDEFVKAVSHVLRSRNGSAMALSQEKRGRRDRKCCIN